MNLPPNTYPFNTKTPPDKRDADPDGNILFHHKDHGWQVAHYDEIPELLEEGNYTHWTYTPAKPSIAQPRIEKRVVLKPDYKPSGSRLFF